MPVKEAVLVGKLANFSFKRRSNTVWVTFDFTEMLGGQFAAVFALLLRPDKSGAPSVVKQPGVFVTGAFDECAVDFFF